VTENGVKENGRAPGSSSNNHDEVTSHPREDNGSSNGGNHHKDNPCESNGSQNGTTHHPKGNLNPCESNGTSHHQEIEKEGVSTRTQPEASSSSTNEDSCILLRKDKSSQDKLEAIKESLKKDASSYLRSCGWYDKVHISMRANKRMRAEQSGGDGNDLKRRLIADVKSSLNSQIPEELKADLVNRVLKISKKKCS
jgi:ubiquitin carboxyl-terminal hydrolase 36/42